jgi:hypothetical protein
VASIYTLLRKLNVWFTISDWISDKRVDLREIRGLEVTSYNSFP